MSNVFFAEPKKADIDGNRFPIRKKQNSDLNIDAVIKELENSIQQATVDKNYSAYDNAIKEAQKLAAPNGFKPGYVTAALFIKENILKVNPAVSNYLSTLCLAEQNDYLLTYQMPEKVWGRYCLLEANKLIAEQQSKFEEPEHLVSPVM